MVRMEKSITLNQLIEELNGIMGKALQPVYVKMRPGEVKEAVCSSDKARKLLNYHPQVSLKQSLEEMVSWIKNQGPKDFIYNQKIEIRNQYTPEVWTRKIF